MEAERQLKHGPGLFLRYGLNSRCTTAEAQGLECGFIGTAEQATQKETNEYLRSGKDLVVVYTPSGCV